MGRYITLRGEYYLIDEDGTIRKKGEEPKQEPEEPAQEAGKQAEEKGDDGNAEDE